jgi:hypothetical protein
VSTGYLRTMGMAIVRGRGIESADRAGAPPVALVSQSFADRAWPGKDPLGQQVRSSADTALITVVGVVAEAKVRSIAGENPFVLYLSREQLPDVPVGEVLVLRTARPLDQIVAEVRGLIREVDSRAAVARVTTMPQVVERGMAEALRLRFFLSLFGGLALVLGIVGVYSVVSYSVSRRQQEFGVRMAVGATPGTVLREVVGRGLRPVVVGTLLGVAGAVALAGVAGRFLYGVSATDPVSIGLAAVALLGSGLAAATVPALRAARVSPVESLRAE